MGKAYKRFKKFFTPGRIIAAGLSWNTHHSAGWAVVHFFFTWWYVLYWLLEFGGKR